MEAFGDVKRGIPADQVGRRDNLDGKRDERGVHRFSRAEHPDRRGHERDNRPVRVPSRISIWSAWAWPRDDVARDQRALVTNLQVTTFPLRGSSTSCSVPAATISDIDVLHPRVSAHARSAGLGAPARREDHAAPTEAHEDLKGRRRIPARPTSDSGSAKNASGPPSTRRYWALSKCPPPSHRPSHHGNHRPGHREDRRRGSHRPRHHESHRPRGCHRRLGRCGPERELRSLGRHRALVAPDLGADVEKTAQVCDVPRVVGHGRCHLVRSRKLRQ